MAEERAPRLEWVSGVCRAKEVKGQSVWGGGCGVHKEMVTLCTGTVLGCQ